MTFEVAGEAYDRFMGRYSHPLAAPARRLARGLRGAARPRRRAADPGALTGHLVERLGADAGVGGRPVAALRRGLPLAVPRRRRAAGRPPRRCRTTTTPSTSPAACLVVHFMQDPVGGLRRDGPRDPRRRLGRGDRVGPARPPRADGPAVGRAGGGRPRPPGRAEAAGRRGGPARGDPRGSGPARRGGHRDGRDASPTRPSRSGGSPTSTASGPVGRGRRRPRPRPPRAAAGHLPRTARATVPSTSPRSPSRPAAAPERRTPALDVVVAGVASHDGRTGRRTRGTGLRWTHHDAQPPSSLPQRGLTQPASSLRRACCAPAPVTSDSEDLMISNTPPHERNPQQPSGMKHERYVPFLPVDLTDRTWPTKRMTQAPALVRGRPARRQPGAHRPDEPGAQARDVRAPREDGLQGDRGRLPGRVARPTSTSCGCSSRRT